MGISFLLTSIMPDTVFSPKGMVGRFFMVSFTIISFAVLTKMVWFSFETVFRTFVMFFRE